MLEIKAPGERISCSEFREFFIQSPAETKDVSAFQKSLLCPWDVRGAPFIGVKRKGREENHSSPFTAKVTQGTQFPLPDKFSRLKQGQDYFPFTF
jgi:hypothetical protein